MAQLITHPGQQVQVLHIIMEDKLHSHLRIQATTLIIKMVGLLSSDMEVKTLQIIMAAVINSNMLDKSDQLCKCLII